MKKRQEIIKFSSIFIGFFCTVGIAYSDTCSTYVSGQESMAVVPDHYKYETPDASGGVNTLVWNNPSSGTTTQMRERPRNGNCTLAPYVYDQNKSTVDFHDNPSCDDDDYGHWDYNVPTVSEIQSSTTFKTISKASIDEMAGIPDSTVGGASVKLPYVAVGWESLGTLSNYKLYAVFIVQPKTTNVILYQLCVE